MQREELNRLVEVLNRQFRPAVTGLPEGFVQAEVTEDGELEVKIGPRMVRLDCEFHLLVAETSISDMPGK